MPYPLGHTAHHENCDSLATKCHLAGKSHWTGMAASTFWSENMKMYSPLLKRRHGLDQKSIGSQLLFEWKVNWPLTWAVNNSVAPLGGVVAWLLVVAPVFEPRFLAVAWFKHKILARYGTVGIPAIQSHQICRLNQAFSLAIHWFGWLGVTKGQNKNN